MPETASQLAGKESNVPPQLPRRKQNARVLLLIAVAVLLGCGALLFFFNPAQHGFYPRCAFYQITGWQCPGCGGLRAMHQLLHGHILTALQLNAIAVIGLPLVAWGLWREVARDGIKVRARWLWLMGAALLLFGIVRNLPGFGWLSP